MILIDKPYVSELLKANISTSGLPLIRTEEAQSFGWHDGTPILEVEEAIETLRQNPDHPVYSSSENALDFVSSHLDFTRLKSYVDLFKDKALFRERLKPYYPNLWFTTFELGEIQTVSTEDWEFPCVVKPAVGFFSLGVYKLDNANAWPALAVQIEDDMAKVQGMYPDSVLNSNTFIVEAWIDGDEYAVDAFFDAKGDSVTLNITKHLFSSSDDVGDRVYFTSSDVMRDMLPQTAAFMDQLRSLATFVNFPLHFEFRMNPQHGLVPIEVNPLRFGAWCTTADLATHAWEFNPLALFTQGQTPDWKELIAQKEGSIFAMVLLNNNSGYHKKEVAHFDHEAVAACFQNTLEYRPIEDLRYPLFGILFTQTPETHRDELEKILHSNLREFMTLRSSSDLSEKEGSGSWTL